MSEPSHLPRRDVPDHQPVAGGIAARARAAAAPSYLSRLNPEQLAAVETKIAQLEALRAELKRMVAAGCHGLAGDCRVIETLADHSLCAHEHAAPERLAPA